MSDTPAVSPAPVRAQDDLFAPAAPVVPAPVKPAEKEKSRPSLFQFVTGRKQAAPADPVEEESDMPAFLRR